MRTDAYITAEAPVILMNIVALVRPFVNAPTQAGSREPDGESMIEKWRISKPG
jgi:hypothetical protein